MQLTFSTSTDFHGTRVTVGLNVTGDDAMAPTTDSGVRTIALTIDPNTGGITMSENRGDNGKMRKGVKLPGGTYTVLKNVIESDLWSICLQSSIPIVIQKGVGESGELLAVAQRAGKTEEATKIAALMLKSLTLGKREVWFEERTVNQVEIRVPNCRNSKLVDIDQVFNFFNEVIAAEPRQTIVDSVDEASAASGSGWQAGGEVRVRTDLKTEVESSKTMQMNLEDVPDDWFDEVEEMDE